MRLAAMPTTPLNSMDLLPSTFGGEAPIVTGFVMALAPLRFAIEEPTRSVPPLKLKVPAVAPRGPLALSRIRMPSVRVVPPV